MKGQDLPRISEVVELALASARPTDRPVYEAAFALDAALGRIISLQAEPALRQIRLAWWKQELLNGRTAGTADPILLSVHQHFADLASKLVAVVDGWEYLLETTPIPLTSLESYAVGRGKLFGVIAEAFGLAPESAEVQGTGWALADYSAHCSLKDEVLLAAQVAEPRPPGRLAQRLRPLAILGGLARRSLARGGGALLGDRMSPFVAARIAVLGR